MCSCKRFASFIFLFFSIVEGSPYHKLLLLPIQSSPCIVAAFYYVMFVVAKAVIKCFGVGFMLVLLPILSGTVEIGRTNQDAWVVGTKLLSYPVRFMRVG